jgi:Xaa-Pro dipeptidase
VTDKGPINYTLCPRTVEEVESVMAGGKWPPLKDVAPELRRKRLTSPNPLPSPPSL